MSVYALEKEPAVIGSNFDSSSVAHNDDGR